MANKRQLKSTINLVCSDLFAECVAASLYGPKNGVQDVDGILSSIIITHNDYISRISHPEPGMAPKVYFNTLVSDFNKQVTEIIDQINTLV